ncbi:MAG TPA: hypothetical protein VK717_01065 [Opitutaceae bacterium]|nr:hypothetical protein [Opitutaceae bacterium]
MSKIVIILSLVLGACVAFVLLLIRRSSEGHEDENGFRAGPADLPMTDESKVAPGNSTSSKSTPPAAAKR